MNKVQKSVHLIVKKSISAKNLELRPVFQGKGSSHKVGGNCTTCGGNVAFGLKLAAGW
ncbi:hypothetical protein [Photobacterium profundum]|uniref:hypothetical protein n=1 Tax=Photobacterium profundum TaxID=74109 RepID=UPI0003189BF0|nr:hypothetical protein [Photobacterium profundum]